MRYLIEYFVQFRRFVGRRVYYLLGLMLVVGFAEGVGITLFLPILQDGFGDDKLSKALNVIFNFFHLRYSFNLILTFILVFFVLRAVFLLSYARYFGKVSSNLLVNLRKMVLDKIFTADYLYILKKEIGYINNALIREISFVVNAFETFSYVLNYTLYALVYMALAMLLNFKAALIVAILGPIFTIFMRRLNLLTNKASIDMSNTHGRFHSILIQALSKLKYLKATFSNLRIAKIIDRENKMAGHLQFKLFFLQSLARDAFEPFIVLIVVGLLFYYVVVLKRSVSEVIFLAFLFLQVARQFMNAQTGYRKFLASRGSIEIFNSFLKELEENKEDLKLEGISPDFDKELLFKDVTIVFPNGKKGLDSVSMVIRPKSVVALVGHSGSGKSTVANMVTGILRPTKGEVSLGDVSYDKINLKTLREKIGYITQEDIIFNASVKDNISLWDERADKKRLKKVIEMAHITAFVDGLPEREDALLGDNGLDISGGQRQRITIARELYKDIRLLILDEATSSLDSKSEKRIYENLRQYKGAKTMLVIAHRLSTIKNADYIYVLDEGRVIEGGTYDELLRRRGEFKRMIEDQMLTEGDEVKISRVSRSDLDTSRKD